MYVGRPIDFLPKGVKFAFTHFQAEARGYQDCGGIDE
jgi:hypothetical protein